VYQYDRARPPVDPALTDSDLCLCRPAGVTLALTPTLAAVLVAVVFVAGTINRVAGTKDRCFVETPAAMAGVGGVSGLLGMYPGLTVASVSVAAAVPAVAGVTFGQRIRGRVGEGTRRAVVLGLLAVIGVRLVLGGLGIA
jgi:uncharacterized membrane protein YfcA